MAYKQTYNWGAPSCINQPKKTQRRGGPHEDIYQLSLVGGDWNHGIL